MSRITNEATEANSTASDNVLLNIPRSCAEIKGKIITYALDEKYPSICRRLSPTYWEDLYQDFLLVLLEYPEEKLMAIRQPKAFLYQILKNMACSSNSKFYKVYRKKISDKLLYEYRSVNASNDLSHLDRIGKAASQLSQEDKEFLKVYVEHRGNAAKVARNIQAPYKKIQRRAARIANEIHNQIKRVA